MAEDRDIQRKTIVVLLILTVVVSVLGTWIILNAEPGVRYAEPPSGDRAVSSIGNVHLRVLEQPKTSATSATGSVHLKILPQD